MFTRSLVCMQNTEEIQLKLWEELITKYALSTIIYTVQPSEKKCSLQKMSKSKNPVILSKNIFSSSNFFMHIFSMPVTCMQNIKKIPC